jgi:phospholipase C
MALVTAQTLPPQTHANIGDRLTEAGINWAWYAGGWAEALAGRANSAAFPSRPNFQPHHQPFNYFANLAPGTAARERHLRDAGMGETARTNIFWPMLRRASCRRSRSTSRRAISTCTPAIPTWTPVIAISPG